MQEYYIGPDLNTQLAALLQKLNVTKVFLVRGKKSYGHPAVHRMMDAALNGRGINRLFFFDFLTNPRVEDVRKVYGFFMQVTMSQYHIGGRRWQCT